MSGSIRRQITTIAAALAAVVLAVAAVAVVVVVKRELIADLDRSLLSRADQLEVLARVDPDAALANSDVEDRFAQLLDADGEVVLATANVAGAPPLADLPTGRVAAETRVGLPIEDDSYRVLIQRSLVGDGYVVVGENVDDLNDAARGLAVSLAIVFPLAVLALAAVVWWLVGRTLRPVETIRSEVASIGIDQLDRRVEVPASDDEITRLATTMNSMLARLEVSAARQREFVGDVSHELRTPLTRMRAALEVDLADTGADIGATARTALGDVVAMQRLVDDLLFFARRDAGAIRAAPLDLDAVVDEEVRAARSLRSDVTVEVVALAPVVVDGSESQLRRVARNLLENAVRHARSRVRVELSESAGTAMLEVGDDGPGIPAADRERVFERFVRLDEARTAGDGGTGLGLAIVREVVHAHGGTVAVGDSEFGGASVTATLPLHQLTWRS